MLIRKDISNGDFRKYNQTIITVIPLFRKPRGDLCWSFMEGVLCFVTIDTVRTLEFDIRESSG